MPSLRLTGASGGVHEPFVLYLPALPTTAASRALVEGVRGPVSCRLWPDVRKTCFTSSAFCVTGIRGDVAIHQRNVGAAGKRHWMGSATIKLLCVAARSP
jgi:hypothetical protein